MKLYTNLLRHSGIYTISVVASKLASVVLLPVYTRYLSPADYGVMELLELTSYIATILIGLNLSDAVFYFYFQAKTDEDRHRVVSTAFIASSIIGILSASIGWLISSWISQAVFQTPIYGRYFHIVFTTMAFIVPQEIGLAYLRVREKSLSVVYFQLARLGLTIPLNLLLLMRYSMGIRSILLSSLASTILVACCMTVVVFRSRRPILDTGLFYQLLRYAAPVGLSGLGMLVLNFGDRFFLQRNVELGEIGIYSLAYRLGMLVSYVQLPFSMYWSSQMFRVVSGPGGARAYVRLCTYFLLALSCAALAVSVFSRPLVDILAAPPFHRAAVFVPAIAAVYVIRGLSDYFRSILFIERSPASNAMVTLTGVAVCLIGYSTLIPPFKLWGAIAATAIGFMTMLVGALLVGQKVRRFDFEFRRIGLAAVTAVGCWGAVAMIDSRQTWTSLAVGAAAMVSWLGTLFLMRFFTSQELAAIATLTNPQR